MNMEYFDPCKIKGLVFLGSFQTTEKISRIWPAGKPVLHLARYTAAVLENNAKSKEPLH